MSRTVRVTVTQADIDASVERGRDARYGGDGDCACPVERAIRRDAGIPNARAGIEVWGLTSAPHEAYALPRDAQRFVKLFTCGHVPEPVSFDLEVPE